MKQALLKGWTRLQNEHKRTGIHVSDLVSGCFRRKVFERLDPDPATFSEKSIMYMFGGELLHHRLVRILGDEDYIFEKEIVWTRGGIDIIGHCDVVHKKTGAIIEFKSTTSIKTPIPNHLKQLSAYVAMTGAPYGRLLYIISIR